MSYREVLTGLIERARDPDKRARYEAELRSPPFPEALRYLWDAFHRLSRRRPVNGFVVGPITWGDIDAFVRNSGFALAPWEVAVIEELDDMYRHAMNEGGDHD